MKATEMSYSSDQPAAGGPLSGLVQPMMLVRFCVGFFYLPHVLGKIMNFPGTVGFFTAAGFPAPEFFVILAGIMEASVGLALLTGFAVKYAAFVSIGLMAVATLAQMSAKGIGWYWNLGGVEYLVYWGIASLAVFLDAWRRNPGLLGAFKSL